MKRIEIEKKLHAAGVTLGDRIIVTYRLSRGQKGTRAFTLCQLGTQTLYLADEDKEYHLGYNEIENVEPVTPQEVTS